MIKKLEFDYHRKNTRLDEKTGKYIGYQVDVYVRRKRKREIFPQQKLAKDFLAKMQLEQVYSRHGMPAQTNPPRISEVFEKKLDKIKTHREFQRAKRVFDFFLNIVGYDILITDVRTAHFQKFINARLDDGVTPDTVRRELVPVCSAFMTASQAFPDSLEGYEPPPINRPKGKKKTDRTVISESEKDAILKYLLREKEDAETAGTYKNRIRTGKLFEIGWLLGLRLGEALKLKKTDFNFNEKKLRVVRWKTGNITMMEYLPDFICDSIQQAIDESETDYIYSISGTPPSDFYKFLRNACENAGLAYGRRELGGVVYHATRHSFTTRLVQITDLATTASFTGHSNKEMVGYYSHSNAASRSAAMKKLYDKPALTDGKTSLTDEDLMEIFFKIRNKELSFKEFKQLIVGEIL